MADAVVAESMTKARKAAVVIASLDREKAALVLKALPPSALQTLAVEISRIREIDALNRDLAFRELAETMATSGNFAGGQAVARTLLVKAVGEKRADELLQEAGKKVQAFGSLNEGSAEYLAQLLSKEQPSVVAMILGYMPAKRSADIISYLPADVREEVVTRLAEKRSADLNVVRRIEQVIAGKVHNLTNKTESSEDNVLGGPEFVAEMLQQMDRSLEEELMNSVEGTAPEAAERIRDLMFSFEDIANLSDTDVQKVLRNVPMDKLVIALRGCKPDIADKITGNLSKRAKENLQEEMDLLGKVRLKDVEAEQRNIVAIVRSLDAAGEIDLRGEEGGNVYV